LHVNLAQIQGSFSDRSGDNYAKRFPRSGVDFDTANVIEFVSEDMHRRFPWQPHRGSLIPIG